jgi:phospholipid/cholesterol/gamma-HCH transport system ATP-binding protein
MPGDNNAPVLQFDHVVVEFGGARSLDDMSFSVSEGETRIILGAANSGKTVLLKTALGLIQPAAGSVRVFGRDISKLTEVELFEIRSRIGMLFQEGALFDSLTIEENVAYPLENQRTNHVPPEQIHQKVTEALRFVELEHTLEKFPSELSGGMRRRVAIARAVVTGPPVLLYDSPTAGLDPITAHTIMSLIIKERDLSHTTTFIVTHRYQDGNLMANFRYNPDDGQLEPARDRGSLRTSFMVLREGRLVFEGDQAELETSNDPYVSKFVKKPG